MTETRGEKLSSTHFAFEKRFWSVLLFVSSTALTRTPFLFLWHRKPSLRDLALHLNPISSHHHNLKKGTTLRGGGGGAVKRRINFPFLFLSPPSQRCSDSLFPFLEKVFFFFLSLLRLATAENPSSFDAITGGDLFFSPPRRLPLLRLPLPADPRN